MDFDFDAGSGLNGNDFNASEWATNLTSIYDHRAIVGLPEWMEGGADGFFDPLNTGNAAVDMINAILLLESGEITAEELAVFNPVTFGGLLDFELDNFADIFGHPVDQETMGDRICDGLETGGDNMMTFGTLVGGAGMSYIIYTGGPTDITDGGAAVIAAFGGLIATIGAGAATANWIFCEP